MHFDVIYLQVLAISHFPILRWFLFIAARFFLRLRMAKKAAG